jgi:hypothetical protein
MIAFYLAWWENKNEQWIKYHNMLEKCNKTRNKCNIILLLYNIYIFFKFWLFYFSFIYIFKFSALHDKFGWI